MKEKNSAGVNTICVHTGTNIKIGSEPVTPSIIMSSSYKMDPGIFCGTYNNECDDPRFAYVRDGHANAHFLEQQLAALEGGEECLVVASGVAACNLSFISLLKSGDHIICAMPSYLSVYNFLEGQFSKKFGVEVTFVDAVDLGAVSKALKPNTKLIHIETPANPITKIIDIAAVANIAKGAGALLTVDSTWASPILQQPLKLGADLVMHSLTKYFNGHGDAAGGAVIGSSKLVSKIRSDGMVKLGAPISPFNAWLIMRGIATLPLRMRQHCNTAMKVARYLEKHPMVDFVLYPGLESHPQHELAKKQMSDYSGMLSVKFKLDIPGHEVFLRALKVVVVAVSLGKPHSLILPFVYSQNDPWYNIMKSLGDDRFEFFMRVSIGLEDAEDIINDFEQAIRAACAASEAAEQKNQ